ncbi:MAG: HNH endonuclease [Peptostreptococcaceae bacterium]|nr:HNH endonuclease [Peptostreptococcaceae bacterium]
MNEKDIVYKLGLAIYLFDNKRVADRQFLSRIISELYIATGIDLNAETLGFHLSCYKLVDPRLPHTKNQALSLYNRYFTIYRTKKNKNELMAFYKLIKSGLFQYSINNAIYDGSEESFFKFLSGKPNNTFKEDIPIATNKNVLENIENSISINKRSQQIKFNALALANFVCEIDNNHFVFQRKNQIYGYTEAHHLIPIKAQLDFDNSLDVEANIISICANCHREIHYGKNNLELVKLLYNKKRERLLKVGLKLNLEELNEYY